MGEYSDTFVYSLPRGIADLGIRVLRSRLGNIMSRMDFL